MFSFKKSNDQAIIRRRLDYALLGAAVLLALTGFMVVISAVSGLSFGSDIIRKFIVAVPLAAGAFLFGWLFNYQIYSEQWKPLYIFTLLFLASVLVLGVMVKGSNSWIRVGFLSIQPSEICRISTILIAAAFLSHNHRNIKEFRTLALFALLIAPLYILIMLQPDFSSLVITTPALLMLLYVAGVDLYYFILLGAFGLTAAVFPAVWTYIALHPQAAQNSLFLYALGQTASNWYYAVGFCVLILSLCLFAKAMLRQFRIHAPMALALVLAGVIIAGFFFSFAVNKHMKPHQRKRIEAYLAPKADPKGASYNVLQAQIAMGAGGVLGKGFFSGTQSRLGFVPERHTDFILAVLGEEIGLLGTLGVLGLYILMLWRMAVIATLSSDRYGYLVCCGIFGIFFTYMMVNFGMLIGIVPVVGIPLPLISYGGSNLVSSFWAFGIVESVYRLRLTIVA